GGAEQTNCGRPQANQNGQSPPPIVTSRRRCAIGRRAATKAGLPLCPPPTMTSRQQRRPLIGRAGAKGRGTARRSLSAPDVTRPRADAQWQQEGEDRRHAIRPRPSLDVGGSRERPHWWAGASLERGPRPSLCDAPQGGGVCPTIGRAWRGGGFERRPASRHRLVGATSGGGAQARDTPGHDGLCSPVDYKWGGHFELEGKGA
ncbi:hypothetical protein chiPu_0029338, partial [Chiloscyllium punctatum]|nr:hypothetical protein [Chiloscyllium punctatum]